MNKTAIKNFAIWAREKLMSDIRTRLGFVGITEQGAAAPLDSSTKEIQYFATAGAEPLSITGSDISSRKRIADKLEQEARRGGYKTAYEALIENTASAWFNRLIAIRFMEVNGYLSDGIRMLSSTETGKQDPDIVTTPFDSDLEFTDSEREEIIQAKLANEIDKVFRILFFKRCHQLHKPLPGIFEGKGDATEFLMRLSVIDTDGVIYHLVHDIAEEDFDISKGGQVEIIGWLYQYYITDLNEKVYNGSLSREKIPKDLLPAATTIYTPDWAIRYMVDNSLGLLFLANGSEIAAKMKYFVKIDESIIEQLKRDEFDIENIKVIDPCMGSGHILVYAFDLLVSLYEERGYLRNEAARLVIENNIYGLDIDDRAFQLSYFAVMMKACQYSRRILSKQIKGHIYSIPESNGIDNAVLKYFGNSMEMREREIAVNDMKGLIQDFLDGKEYGSILKIRDYNWNILKRFVNLFDYEGQMDVFSGDLTDVQEKLIRIVDAGEVLAGKYDVVVTNPPYLGSKRFNRKLDEYTKKHFQDERTDLSMAMFKQSLEQFSTKKGLVSFITTSSWMTNSTFSKLRQYMQENTCVVSLADFGTELFEGKVGHNPAVAWVSLNKRYSGESMTAIRLVDYCYSRREEKQEQFFKDENRYSTKQSNFQKIDGQPFAYWISNSYFNIFEAPILSTFLKPKQGTSTGDNDRFLRLWYEVSDIKIEFNHSSGESTTKRWFPATKGGDFRKWYGNNEYVVDWENDGQRIRDCKSSAIRNAADNFKEGLTWTGISSKALGIRYCPKGFVYLISGKGIIGKKDMLYYALAFCCSKVADSILRITSPNLSFEVGYISGLPLIVSKEKKETVDSLTNENISMSKEDWDAFETSWDFKEHPLVRLSKSLWDATAIGALIEYYYGSRQKVNCPLELCFLLWKGECNERFKKLKYNEEELNRIFIDIYSVNDELTSEVEESDVTIRKADLGREIRSLLSYAVGCMFGRYSLAEDGLVFAGSDWDKSRYGKYKPDADNIIPILDAPYFEDDIVKRIEEFISIVFGEDSLDANISYIAKALDAKSVDARDTIRSYFLNDFFKDHCSMYSTTGSGKRPIYWLFDSGKQNGFKALVYMHHWNADIEARVRALYLHKVQEKYENEVKSIDTMIEHMTDSRMIAKEEKRKEKLKKQIAEVKDYDEILDHIANERIDIDLDDGVKVNYEKVQTDHNGKKYQILAPIK